MKETKALGFIRQEFDSITDVMEWIGDTADLRYCNSQHETENDTGCKSWGEMVRLITHGWTAAASSVSDRLREIEKAQTEKHLEYQWDVEGDFFDVGSVVEGLPECWMRPTEVTAKRVVRIAVAADYSGSIPVQQIYNRGAAIVALIDTLQRDPTNIVELTVGVWSADAGEYKRQEMLVSFGMSPLSIDSISFALAHPAWLRRLTFAVLERNYNNRGGRYGAPDNMSQEEQKEYGLYIPAAYAASGLAVFSTPEGSARWVEEQAARLTTIDNPTDPY